jgi:hypothetical protein
VRLGVAVRRASVVLALSLGGLLAPATAATTAACAAAGDGPHAALVVDTGDRVETYCVALDAPSVSGIRLIELAAGQHGLEYALGFGGGAVCRLAGVGVDGGDCFAAFPDFWGYWHGDGRGGWTWAPTGAASYGVADGAVEGWSWGSGDSPATHASPPPTTIADVCGVVDDPSPPPGGGDGGSGGTGGGGGPGGDGQGGGGSQGTQPGGAGGGGATGGGATGGGATGGGPGSSDPGAVDQPAGGDLSTGAGADPSSGPTGDAPVLASGATGAGGAAAAPTGSGEDAVRAAAADDGSGSAPLPGVAGAIVVISALAIGGWWRLRRGPGGTR